MRLTATNYLDVISSWCYWAIPAWLELRERYSDRVDFQWKIALMDKSGLPPTRAHTEWYYTAQRNADAFPAHVERQLGRTQRHRISRAELCRGSRRAILGSRTIASGWL